MKSVVSRLILEIQRASEAGDLPSEAQLTLWAGAPLPADEGPLELVIRLVDEAESRRLNRDYRGIDKPTNVLSFPFDPPPEVPLPLLGDLVICAPVVVREAAEQGKPADAHWAHMVIHGVLHLLGYDHQSDDEARRMEQRERELLRRLHFSDPYLDEDR